jgi:hypothetical protein
VRVPRGWEAHVRRHVTLLAFFLSVLSGPAAAQTSAGWPRIEFGGQAAVLTDGEKITAAGPRILVNFTRGTALDVAADLQIGPGSGSQAWEGNSNLVFVQLRRTVSESRKGALFATVGVYTWFSDKELPASEVARIRSFLPGFATSSTITGLTVGFGVRREISRHLALEAQVRGIFGQYNVARFEAGVAIPAGSFPAERPVAPMFAVPNVSRTTPARVQAGQRVWVTMTDGREITGHVSAFSTASLELRTGTATTSIPLDTVRKIEIPDSLTDGILIGLGVGAGAGVASGFGYCAAHTECSPGIPPIFTGVGAGIGAVIGWLMDARHEVRHLLYEAPGKGSR